MARRPDRSRAVATGLLAAYLLALAFIAFWPEHIDRGAGPFLAAVQRVFPWATHGRIEFASNVLLFVPLGLLLTLMLRSVWKVLALGIAATVTIELVQAVLPDRTPSLLDVLANSAGTAVGIALALVGAAVFARRLA